MVFYPSLEKRGRGDFLSPKRGIPRRGLAQALSYAVLSILLLALPKASVAQTPVKVAVAYSAVSPIFAGVWMAKETGAFEKQGLKADLVYISSGSITVQSSTGS
jgi:ABC-type nitrate/sulfonate/bicarbonate transport system substrate-binding protein